MDIQQELIAEYDRETAITRKVLAAIPADADLSFKSHPRSMSLGRIAGHTAEALTQWVTSVLTLEKLEMQPGDTPYIPASTTALLEKFDADLAKARAALVAFDPADWEKNWQLIIAGRVVVEGSKWEIFRTWVLSHSIHHRAQLGVDLRLIGAKLPGVYGPSADEMPS